MGGIYTIFFISYKTMTSNEIDIRKTIPKNYFRRDASQQQFPKLFQRETFISSFKKSRNCFSGRLSASLI
ncbi:hypothetical protein LEP1GSC070_2889 [Leptospira santarosai str. AIM]|uniref:Uncharacterized protein n=1 Tax=Leptospira santarosai serovar Shermani str. LT 821 TaxID=758847 RepID=A0A097ESB5_9LEPT|nr:hypothetical protein LSS_21030 [Leptospira santarosai serovar Shermani str. LT 821]EMO86206.1 hypothetical protein LEP1GSC070_2889 [Leptospira santarosai str. AIM]EPG81895.1 hypothetical protein LEP1GSC048_2645 [Leptospira santarosai serovar Shermani str. 1342KT]